MSDDVNKPSEFSPGELALIRQTAWEVVKADRTEHAEQHEKEMEHMVASVLTEARAASNNGIVAHANGCVARHAAGRLRTWGPACIGALCGVLIGAGVVNIPAALRWAIGIWNGS